MKYFPADIIEFTLGYRYLNSYELPGKTPIPGKIMHKGHGGILLKLPYRIHLNTRAQYFGSRNDSYVDETSNTVVQVPSISAYWLFHANVTKTFSNGLVFSIGGRNLSNQINAQWGPVPGREWYTGLSFNF
jgi:outer membrane receptor protein involved in Fe transport